MYLICGCAVQWSLRCMTLHKASLCISNFYALLANCINILCYMLNKLSLKCQLTYKAAVRAAKISIIPGTDIWFAHTFVVLWLLLRNIYTHYLYFILSCICFLSVKFGYILSCEYLVTWIKVKYTFLVILFIITYLQ
jgi:hypothetical protein